MTVSAALGTALSGMLAQQHRLSNVASNVANVATPDHVRRVTQFSSADPNGVTTTTTTPAASPAAGGPNIDLATEMLDLIGAKIAFEANASVFETGADMWELLTASRHD